MCECGHKEGWHLYSDGPHKRICNNPKCTCTEFQKAE